MQIDVGDEEDDVIMKKEVRPKDISLYEPEDELMMIDTEPGSPKQKDQLNEDQNEVIEMVTYKPFDIEGAYKVET